MPKLVVVVEKDAKGKLWEYAFSSADLANKRNVFENTPLILHKYNPPSNLRDKTVFVGRRQKDVLTISVLSASDDIAISQKVKGKAKVN